MPGEELLSFWQTMHRQVRESRDVHGLRHPQATVLTITFAYLLSGGQGGHRAVVAFGRDLSPTQRAARHLDLVLRYLLGDVSRL